MSAIERLLEALDSQIDAALIVSDANRFYFTGFPSSAGTLLILSLIHISGRGPL